ncbi:21986_t:CDS:2 [Racocetra persica]|uniref:21986_t:CDS:1 n=1 Tax=Racocetra persica TaxID=160502 RepID=A0ACA9QIX5_9GLOM|nr:21986_t:CDS:2 [Racocetra persica]
MVNLSELRRTNCTDAEWYEDCKMPQVRDNETPSEWMDRIWPRLQYFRKNDLLPTESKKYLEARKLLIYTGERTANIGNYNHIGMERHWKFSCSGNKYCGVNYDEYLKIKQKSNSAYSRASVSTLNFNDIKIERAREIGKKIRAAKVIQQKWLELFYRPEGMCAIQLAQHYQLLWAVREEMCQINNV